MVEIQLSNVRIQPRITEGLQWWNPLEAEDGDWRLWRRIARWGSQERGLLCPIDHSTATYGQWSLGGYQPPNANAHRRGVGWSEGLIRHGIHWEI